MEKVSRLLPSETWSLLLIDEASQTLRFELSVDLDLEKMKNFELAIGQGAAGHCAQKQELLVIEDVANYAFFNGQVDAMSGCRTESLVCVPIVFAGRTLGVLELINPKSLDKAGIELLNLVSDYVAIGMENTRRYRKMHEMAIRDSLTGLYNQRHLYRSVESLIERCKIEGSYFSLIFMDIDNFKTVVDTEGHLNGSRALREVAQTIKGCLDDSAFAIAYGGDEFVVVLPGADRRYAAKTAAEIREAINSATYLTGWGRKVQVTASFGVATFPDHASDIKALLALADQAMYRVKNSGKDRVELTV
jgi:diguanylate cyclase (GGDEF)-like protein